MISPNPKRTTKGIWHSRYYYAVSTIQQSSHTAAAGYTKEVFLELPAANPRSTSERYLPIGHDSPASNPTLPLRKGCLLNHIICQLVQNTKRCLSEQPLLLTRSRYRMAYVCELLPILRLTPMLDPHDRLLYLPPSGGTSGRVKRLELT